MCVITGRSHTPNSLLSHKFTLLYRVCFTQKVLCLFHSKTFPPLRIFTLILAFACMPFYVFWCIICMILSVVSSCISYKGFKEKLYFNYPLSILRCAGRNFIVPSHRILVCKNYFTLYVFSFTMERLLMALY